MLRHTRKKLANGLLRYDSIAFYRKHSTTADMLELDTPLLYSYWGGRFTLQIKDHKSFDILSIILNSTPYTKKPLKKRLTISGYYYCGLIEYHAAQQNLAEAFSTAEQFLQEMKVHKQSNLYMYSHTPGAYRYLGLFHLKRNEHSQAINCFKKAVEVRTELNQDSTTEKIDLAIAYIFIGEIEEAIKEINSTLRKMLTRSIDYTDVLSLRGICNILKGQAYYEIANQDFENACRLIRKPWPQQIQHILQYDRLCV